MSDLFKVPSADVLTNCAPYLHIAEEGKMQDIQTYFAKNVLEEFNSLEEYGQWLTESVAAIYKSSLPTRDADTMIEYERANYYNWGPIFMLPWSKREEDLSAYYRKLIPMSGKTLRNMAVIGSTIFERSNRLTPISLSKASTYMEPSTNSGLPSFTKRRLALQEDMILARGLLENLSKGDLYGAFPAISFWRGQPGGANPKQRLVWGVPQSVNLVEALFYVPLFEFVQSQNILMFSAWKGPEKVDEAITHSFNRFGDGYYLSADYSGYDQSIGSLWPWAAILLRWAYQERYHETTDNLIDMLSRIPMITPSDRTGKSYGYAVHGMPSGIMFTNFMDSFINWASIMYATDKIDVGWYKIVGIQGDDAVIHFDEKPDLDAYISAISDLGLEMNEQKQFMSRNAILYLRRYHFRSWKQDGINVGIASTLRTFGSIVRQERYHDNKLWNKQLAALRTIMILQNLYGSPTFEFAIEQVRRFDPELRQRNFLEDLLSSRDEARKIPGFISTYNAPKMDGMQNWSSYKRLIELSD